MTSPLRPLKIFSVSEIPTGDENRSGQEEALEQIIRAAPVIRQFAQHMAVWQALGTGERTRENISFTLIGITKTTPLINLGPDSKLTCNVPGLGSKL